MCAFADLPNMNKHNTQANLQIHVVVVEDHNDLREELVLHLECAGYTAIGLPDGSTLDQHLHNHLCHLVVLDLGLPGEDGLTLCKRVRSMWPHIGVVMLTARGLPQDRLLGLQSQADAYLVKPTPPQELLAVIDNLLRRLHTIDKNRVSSGCAPCWRFSTQTLQLTIPDGPVLALTHHESILLQTLIRCGPGPASRRELIEALGGSYLDYDERRLEIGMSRLRRKLQAGSGGADVIRAARGVGYQLTLVCQLEQ